MRYYYAQWIALARLRGGVHLLAIQMRNKAGSAFYVEKHSLGLDMPIYDNTNGKKMRQNSSDIVGLCFN